WEVASGREKATFKGHTFSVSPVAFSPDGRTLASSDDKMIKLWDVASGQEKVTLQGGCMSLAFSPDGRTLVSGILGGTVKLWRGATDAEVARQCNRCGRKD
ncbi:MAG TPA: hypothetical protein VFZ34_23060, partial [Blastocatellia bacterium]|nr:hypothetical protein [Blastocatellia bacterium]